MVGWKDSIGVAGTADAYTCIVRQQTEMKACLRKREPGGAVRVQAVAGGKRGRGENGVWGMRGATAVSGHAVDQWRLHCLVVGNVYCVNLGWQVALHGPHTGTWPLVGSIVG